MTISKFVQKQRIFAIVLIMGFFVFSPLGSSAQTLTRFDQLQEALKLGNPQVQFTRQPPSETLGLTDPSYASYPLSSGDQIQVSIWSQRVNQTYQLTVSPRGEVVLPQVGSYRVQGKTLSQTEPILLQAINLRFKDAVTLKATLIKVQPVQVLISGFVVKPGYYDLPWGSSLLELIRRAGGIKDNGSVRQIQVHKDQLTQTIDLLAFQSQGNIRSNPVLRGGEKVHVPTLQARVALLGEVQTPGIYEIIPPETSLTSVLDMAGGLKPLARPQEFLLWRQGLLSENAQPQVQPLTRKVVLKPGDVAIFEPRKFPTEDKVIHILGQVQEPGAIPYRQGLSLKDCLNLAKGPRENADLGAIKVSRQQNGKTEVFQMNLETQMFQPGQNTPFLMQAGDTIFVPERFFNIRNFSELTTLLLTVLGIVSVVLNLSRGQP